MNVIEIENLTKIFRTPLLFKKVSHVALDNVTLHLEQGSIHTILGPNGAGKTTLLLIMAGIIAPTSGKLKVNGRTGLCTFTGRGFWNYMGGIENLRYCSALFNIVGRPAKKRIDRLVDLLEMRSYISRKVSTYSAGMKQKLSIAQSLLHDPDILLLDEPIAHLDPIASKNFHWLLKERVSQELKKTIILSTHQLEEAQELSDRLYFLFGGRLLWQKEAEVFRSKQENLLQEYLNVVG